MLIAQEPLERDVVILFSNDVAVRKFEHAVSLMQMYPQLYSVLCVLLWVLPLTQHYAVEFLKLAKVDRSLTRVLFGTDQMVWPGAIEKSIQFLNILDFLNKENKQNILYNIAARFFKLNIKTP